MAKLEVLTIPDLRLRIKAKPVAEVNDEIRKIFEDLLETMCAEEGIGLAATQVNIHQRLLVMDLKDENSGVASIYKMANPKILWCSEETNVCNEGCLSVPEYRADVRRPARIRVQYLDENNQLQTLEAEGLLATCIQHEMDHLDGKVFLDHLSPLKRQMALQKLMKMKSTERVPVR